MSRRVFSLALLAVVGLVAAGCVGDDGVTGASVVERAGKVNDMLARPPGSDVQPTGVTKEFSLYLHRMDHELYPGASMGMWALSFDPDPATASVPGPTIRVTEGDTVVVHFKSMVAGFNHTLHFHGQNVPFDQDGVPYVTQAPIEPDAEFTYVFIAKPAGTYWYHCHVDAQHHIDMGMYGALIVDPQDPAEDPRYDKEFLMIVDEMDRFHLEGGQPAAGNAPQDGSPESYEEWLRRQASDSVNRNPQVADRVTGSPARPARDWYPTTYAPYTAEYNTFLINGQAFPYTQPLLVKEGDIIRVRLINAGNTVFAMHLHGHHVLVTHKDGVLLESPYWVDTILIGPSERYDLYAKMDNPGMWDFHDHIGGHTQNDNIFPGGAMTMLCYEGAAACAGGGGHQHGAHVRHSGDLIGWSGDVLA